MPRPRRSRADIVAAVRRVQTEELVPLSELTSLAKGSVQSLTRWAIEGRSKVYLDAVKRDGVWVSSVPAVLRFLAELEIKRLVALAEAGPK